MKKKNGLIDKFLDIAPGGIYGILSIIIRISGDFLAFLFFPREYSFFNNMVSDLGVGPGGIFFSLGLIISGIFSIPFYVALARSLECDGSKEEMRKIGLIFFYISDFAYIMVGFFPSDKTIYIVYVAHGFFAIISWLTGIIYLIIFSKLMLENDRFTKLSAYSGFILVGFMILFLCTWLPIFEWIMTIAFITYVIYMSMYLLHDRFELTIDNG